MENGITRNIAEAQDIFGVDSAYLRQILPEEVNFIIVIDIIS